jgi:translation initiation factor 2 alpha subunit (eIF-2alpha)
MELYRRLSFKKVNQRRRITNSQYLRNNPKIHNIIVIIASNSIKDFRTTTFEINIYTLVAQ